MPQTKQTDRRLVRQIGLQNLLSFGPDPVTLELENLNILIGPNAAGKSNLIEARSWLPAGGRAYRRGNRCPPNRDSTYYRFEHWRPVVNGNAKKRKLASETINPELSILA